jgi:hypothetical protein
MLAMEPRRDHLGRQQLAWRVWSTLHYRGVPFAIRWVKRDDSVRSSIERHARELHGGQLPETVRRPRRRVEAS